MFARLDEDHDGVISILEFTDASWHDAPYELWDQDDANGDGQITKEEFGTARNRNSNSNKIRAGGSAQVSGEDRSHVGHGRSGGARDEGAAVDLFALLDDNGDGCVTAAEFEADWHMPPAGLFGQEDANGDGCIRRSEFGASVPPPPPR